ncbi:MAG TPA: DUF6249 domain-containing protein [Steroidobacteraceae bacterium]|jgi:hypothetical protein|nr:DUF6249 domain-containing protein [Steroidobacteraceae bacterium]
MTSDALFRPDVLSLLIPILGIIMGIGFVMLAIYLDFLKKREILNAVHRERMAAIEKGMELPPLPPEIFRGRDRGRSRTPARTLERGLILIFIGIAVSVALWQTGKNAAWWGLVPFGMGLAYLISSRFRAVEQERSASRGSSEADGSSR